MVQIIPPPSSDKPLLSRMVSWGALGAMNSSYLIYVRNYLVMLPSFDFVFLCRDSAMFKQAWLGYALLSVCRRFVLCARLTKR